MTHTRHQPARLEEQHLRTFLQPKPRWHEQYRIPLLVAGVASLFVLVFAILNAPALLRVRTLEVTPSGAEPAFVAVNPSPTPSVTSVENTPTIAPTSTPEQIATQPDNTITVSGSTVSAPVLWKTALDDRVIYKALEKGVTHIDGTPQPGNKGFSIIFGHSSNYPWAPGNYKNVFAPLVRVKPGATVTITFQGVTYTYQVTKVFEIQPTELDILNSTEEVSGVRLITCTPVGTSLRRLVVEAEQVSPNPAANTSFTQKTFTGQLPADR